MFFGTGRCSFDGAGSDMQGRRAVCASRATLFVVFLLRDMDLCKGILQAIVSTKELEYAVSK